MPQFPLIVAFGFVSPVMLWGLALGAVPIGIHLLHRRRFVEQPWAAMRFLIAATKKQSRRLRLEQLLLLIVRTLILVLASMALARPSVEKSGGPVVAEEPCHQIIVVDSTLSMGYRHSEQSCFERAKEFAKHVVRSAQDGDAFHVVRLSDSAPRVIAHRPTYDTSVVLNEIDHLPLLDERADVSSVLQEIEELLMLAPTIPHKKIYFVTDLQATEWSSDDSTDAGGIRRQLKRLSERADLVFADVSEAGPANVAVTDLRIKEGFALSGREVPTVATLCNYGSGGVQNQRVELYLDDRLVDSKQIDLPAGSDVRIDFSPTFSSGDHRLEVRLNPDGLRVDDSRWLIVPVRDELQVLLVNGKPSGEAMGNATDFLKLALAPELPNQHFSSPIRPTVIREGEFLGTDLERFDCVFVCNVAMFTERETTVLRDYLETGGGVIFCLGDQVRAENYNHTLFQEGSPILPGKLVERIGDSKTTDLVYEFDAGDFSHPIVRPFQGNPRAGLELTKTFSYFKVEVPENRAARVALRFNNGDPAILDSPYGHGRVILITTSIDREWSTWAVWGHSLIPLMHETVNYAIADRWAGRDVSVGQPLVSRVSRQSAGLTAVLQIPGGETQTPNASSDGRTLISEPTTKSGFHQMALGTPLNRSEWFAVNVDSRESDLTSLRDENLKEDLIPGVNYRYLKEWTERPTIDNPPDLRFVVSNVSFSRTFLLAVFGLLLVEFIMAWNFVAGTVLLIGLMSLALTVSLWMVSPTVGLVSGSMLGSAVAFGGLMKFGVSTRP